MGSSITLKPVHTLTSRLMYYPLSQILSIIGGFYWQFKFGSKPRTIDTTEMKVAALFAVICLPSAGIGFFITFLTMQPHAWKHFKIFMKKNMNYFCFCRKMTEDQMCHDEREEFLSSSDRETSYNDMDEDDLEEQIRLESKETQRISFQEIANS